MIYRALEFLDRWEADNIQSVPPPERQREAKRLAEICREDAIRAGVSLDDLHRVADGNLIQNMLDALEWATRGKE